MIPPFLIGAGCCFLAAIFWASSGTFSRTIFDSGFTAQDLVQARMSLAFFILLIIKFFKDKSFIKFKKETFLDFILFGVLGFSLNQFFYFFSISKIEVGVAILLEFLAPSLLTLFHIFYYKRRPTTILSISLMLSLIGTFFALDVFQVPLTELNHIGIIAGLLAAVTFAFYSFKAEKLNLHYSALDILLGCLFLGTIFWNIAHPPFQFVEMIHSETAFPPTLYIVIFGTIIPFYSYFFGIQKIGPIWGSFFATLEPICAIFLSAVFLNEHLNNWQLFGAGVVIFALFLPNAQKLRRNH